MPMAEPNYVPLAGFQDLWYCKDGCGCLVVSREDHTRFHSILSGHAWALAVLKTAHIASHVHDAYDVPERIDSKHFDNWSADALAQVVAEMDAASEHGSKDDG
jgi:hypothetical protein